METLNSKESIERFDREMWESTEKCLEKGWLQQYMNMLWGNVFLSSRGIFVATYGSPILCVVVDRKLSINGLSIYDVPYHIEQSISGHYKLSIDYVRGMINGFASPKFPTIKGSHESVKNGIEHGKIIRSSVNAIVAV